MYVCITDMFISKHRYILQALLAEESSLQENINQLERTWCLHRIPLRHLQLCFEGFLVQIEQLPIQKLEYSTLGAKDVDSFKQQVGKRKGFSDIFYYQQNDMPLNLDECIYTENIWLRSQIEYV